MVQNLTERLDRIERTQLPEIETRVQRALDAPLSQVPLLSQSKVSISFSTHLLNQAAAR